VYLYAKVKTQKADFPALTIHNNISINMNPYNYNQGIPKDNYSLAAAAIYDNRQYPGTT
jgi:uncharacterized protein (DUF2164 family)